MHTRYLLPMLSVGVFITAISCGSKTETEATKNESIPVKTKMISPTNIAIPVFCTGIVSSNEEARLSFKTGGIIASTFVEEGDRVSKGQMLATLSMNEINAQVNQATEAVEKARRDVQRAESLQKEKAATLEQVQNAKTGLAVAEQTLTIAKFNQQYSAIVSPVTGRVIRKLMNEGELAGPGTPVFIVESDQSDDRILKTSVSDVEWVRLSTGDSAKVQLDAYPGISFTAVIDELAAAADPFTGTFPLTLKFVNLTKPAASGMVGRISIIPQQLQEQLLVPMEALYEANEGKALVYLLNSDRKSVTRREVSILTMLKDQAVISGLEGQQEIIVSGVAYLRDKAQVTVQSK